MHTTSHGHPTPGIQPDLADRPLTVALLLETDGPGGAEMMFLHLAAGLIARGHRVVPVGPANGSGWLGGRLRSELSLVPRSFHLRGRVDPACVWELSSMFRTEAVDVVHGHEFAMASYATLAARLRRLPSVVTFHSAPDHLLAVWRRRAAMRWAIRTAHEATTISDATREVLVTRLGLDRDTVRAIPNGVPVPQGDGTAVRRELGINDEMPLLLAVGNLYPVKGHDILIQALGVLARENPDVRWVAAIAGRGEEQARLQELTRAMGIEDRLRLLGFRSEVGALLHAADLFVHPSRSEGLPLAVIEAMSTGLAVVASDVGGLREVVTPGVDGELVRPEDPQALAQAILGLLSDPGRRERLADAARRTAVERFGVDSMVEEYLDVYHSTVARANRKARP
jgi:glycosyltransferase involved in cell wall biosynthesis